MITSFPKQPERVPFELPVTKITDKLRLRVLEVYEAKIGRLRLQEDRFSLLNALYEQAYSAGLKDMDNMHKTIDAMIEHKLSR